MQREIVIVIGMTGYGKSNWLRKFLRKFPKLFVFDPYKAVTANYLSEEQLLECHENGTFKKTPAFQVGSYLLPDLDLLGSIAFQTIGSCFTIEECGVCFGKGERIPDWLSEMAFLGRHQAVSLVLTAQRATSIPIELRSQANRFVSFRQIEKKDLDWTRQYIGDAWEDLPELEELECIDSEKNSVTRYRCAWEPPTNSGSEPQAQSAQSL